jgi:hypothetical protein
MIGSVTEFLRRSKKTILLIVVVAGIAILLTTTIAILLSGIDELSFPSVGTIHVVGVEVYGGNITLINGTQSIDWGTIYLGTLTNRSFYVHSKSNMDIVLNLTITDWTFLDPEGKSVTGPTNNYMNVTWDYAGTPISPDGEVYATLTLWASDESSFIDYLVGNNVKGFSFDIHISPV